MAKAPTLLEQAKKLKIGRSGAKDWHELLTPAQQKDFDELMAWYKGLPVAERPSKKDFCQFITDNIANITAHTFAKYYDAK